MDADIRIHMQMMIEDYILRGMSPEDAVRAAELRMGDIRAVREQGVEIIARLAHRERLIAWFGTIAQDIRFAGRMFARDKAWTTVAVLTLGIGIGATSAVFSIVNAAILRPLPYPEPDRIVTITTLSDGEAARARQSLFEAWYSRSKEFFALAAYRETEAVLRGGAEPEEAWGRRVTGAFFGVFGVEPLLGRVFAADDYGARAARTVILAEQTWRRLYGGDSTVIGRTILLDEDPVTVVGVMPASLTASGTTQYWEPYGALAAQRVGAFVATPFVSVVGRLSPHATLASARAELQTLTPPRDRAREGEIVPVVTSLHDARSANVRPALQMLLAAAGVMLLIACANVANLLLARGTLRQREFAVRAAIGASSWRLVRFLFCETALLGLAGAVLGLFIARGTLGIFLGLRPAALARVANIGIDGGVLVFTLATALAMSFLFGLLPALQLRRSDAVALLVANPTAPSCRRRNWTRRALVVGELAVALMLVTGAGLLLKSFSKVTSISTGMDPARVMVAAVQLSPRYSEAAVGPYFDRVTAAVLAIPGVENVALSDVAPLSGGVPIEIVEASGVPRFEYGVVAVSRSFFRTVGLEIVAGRAFDASDVEGSEPVTILNATAAQHFGGARRVIGRRLPLGNGGFAAVRVVGVARDVRQLGVENAAPAIVYLASEQNGGLGARTAVIVRTADDPSPVIPAMQAVLRSIDPQEPLPPIQTLESQLADAVAPRRFTFALLTAFASVGALLAMIGLYGVMSYVVAERTKELGLRIALGADRRRIMRFVFGEGMVLVATGVVLGLAGSLAGVRLLRTMLFQVDAYDPAVFGLGAGLLVITALIACAVPARRATSIDPLKALTSS